MIKFGLNQLNNDRPEMTHGNKLRTYRLFKQNIRLESYLMLENCNSKNKLTKFRISVHDLEIEKGRYKNIPADKRFCKLCNRRCDSFEALKDVLSLAAKDINLENAQQLVNQSILFANLIGGPKGSTLVAPDQGN